MRNLFLIAALIIAGPAEAKTHDPHWLGPGCYIVYPRALGPLEIVDGSFSDDAACRARLGQMQMSAYQCVELNAEPDGTRPTRWNDPAAGGPCRGAKS